eukprot:CAMPEP_0113676446 /NCGR_PEP_ID=MMETSP0038_2-20120614/8648_1 /TAXON_ID=2898 /ORGANISM="Cryptomonas paramecium" /LENGTH=73 /DNA_ID=CAMNT_0000593477 /DNA_START=51 /DNA_END=272 /DNA_ORIENTATION=- /assembly_acc=CAM_ASM_000170
MLFAIVPFKSLEAGPEFFNNMYAPHNCVGGSEQGCEPGIAEASIMFKDPSKMNRPFGVPKPDSWYKDGKAEFL